MPASCTPSDVPSKSASCEDLGVDHDASLHRGMCITFKVNAAEALQIACSLYHGSPWDLRAAWQRVR